MIETMFCQYETPCGWCIKFDAPCTEKGDCKPRKRNDETIVNDKADKNC